MRTLRRRPPASLLPAAFAAAEAAAPLTPPALLRSSREGAPLCRSFSPPASARSASIKVSWATHTSRSISQLTASPNALGRWGHSSLPRYEVNIHIRVELIYQITFW